MQKKIFGFVLSLVLTLTFVSAPVSASTHASSGIETESVNSVHATNVEFIINDTTDFQ
ncbi:hypothetical protein LROSL1_2316 [Furfurilactobacillus rossiae]|nr:hypothetical protein LROSL1_2316 [Furfurilactobacillus rossiae]